MRTAIAVSAAPSGDNLSSLFTYQFQTMERTNRQFKRHGTFMEAWKDMFEYVNGQIQKNQMTLQFLETSLWIEVTQDGKKTLPIFFYGARDRAILDHNWHFPQ